MFLFIGAVFCLRLVKLYGTEGYLTKRGDVLVLEGLNPFFQYVIIKSRRLYFFIDNVYYTLGMSGMDINVKMKEINIHKAMHLEKKAKTLDVFGLGGKSSPVSEEKRSTMSWTQFPPKKHRKEHRPPIKSVEREIHKIKHDVRKVEETHEVPEKRNIEYEKTTENIKSCENSDKYNYPPEKPPNNNHEPISYEQHYKDPRIPNDNTDRYNYPPDKNLFNNPEQNSRANYKEKPKYERKRFHIESDSSMIDSIIYHDVEVEEQEDDTIKLVLNNHCITYYNMNFIFAPCIKSKNQKFQIVKEEDTKIKENDKTKKLEDLLAQLTKNIERQLNKVKEEKKNCDPIPEPHIERKNTFNPNILHYPIIPPPPPPPHNFPINIPNPPYPLPKNINMRENIKNDDILSQFKDSFSDARLKSVLAL